MQLNAAATLDWVLIVLLFLVDAVLLLSTNFRLIWQPEIIIFFAALILAAVSLFYGRYRQVPRLARMANTGCLVVLFTDAAAVFNYIMDGILPRPLWDGRFDAMDRLFGLNWLAIYHWVTARPLLFSVSNGIYAVLGMELFALLLLLEGLGRHQRATELRHCFFVSALTTICIGILMPAAGPFAFYHLPVAHETAYVVQYAALRDGSLRLIDLANAQGLVSFPSFHTALAVLCAYAARGIPYLARPALLLNILIICTSPVIGGHYYADIAAGLALAAATIALRHHAGLRLGWTFPQPVFQNAPRPFPPDASS